MEIEILRDQETRLVWPRFGANDAINLGLILLDRGRKDNLPILINIRTPNHTLFHAALPGATPLNDLWAQRKSNAVLHYHMSSLHLGETMRARGKTFANDGLPDADYAAHGGSFPIRLAGGPVIAAVTVSGLPQVDDHALVVAALTQALCL
ncbi:heme-degrading domain-containing protein [Pseudorhodobacter ferrugineus]|uniref:heme-degrading domain-containing protein n=1 Tax=Pseudorhodobacter ferrugineus TaxID=77008 RepID=UPI0003B66253|nr:heme-degrading domain-containing protein [Pseudorhodobacter ferrugineus]